ncbi:MAG: type IV toxin-antitoxin system AbiEi family antitoxin domain-containing protein [Candidatus Woesebacteria bacterium]|nr:type IV toxin-antitoxin system AbiEi family antitoxin domain-containing protein [Candidatus Woesebacteria bacterium]
MKKGNYITKLLKSDRTVFTTKDINLIWGEQGNNTSWTRISYYVCKGYLRRIRKGIYTKGEEYNKFELATRMFTPSYISFETVLAKEGLIFQYYERIDVATYLTRELKIDDKIFSFRKLKNSILMDSFGVDIVDNTSIATKERAFLDMLYIDKNYYFDNLRSLDWDDVFKLLPIYENKNLSKKVKELYELKHI